MNGDRSDMKAQMAKDMLTLAFEFLTKDMNLSELSPKDRIKLITRWYEEIYQTISKSMDSDNLLK